MKNITFVLWFLVMIPWIAPAQRQFVHPGLSHKQSDLDRMKAMVNAKVDPWYSSYIDMCSKHTASFDYQVQGNTSLTQIYRDAPRTNLRIFEDDSRAAYYNALRWYIEGDERHAQKAVECLNAWTGLTYVQHNGTAALTSNVIIIMLEAAELVKSTYDGWSAVDIKKFEDMLVYPGYSDTTIPPNESAEGTWYWRAYKFDPVRAGNQELCGIRTTMAIGIFLDNEKIYDRALRYITKQPGRTDDIPFPKGPHVRKGEKDRNKYRIAYDIEVLDTEANFYGNGALTNYVYENGQAQESSRDQAHTSFGLGLLCSIGEIAWNQGDDIWGHAEDRILLGLEYSLKYGVSYFQSHPDQPNPWEPTVESGEFIQRDDATLRNHALAICPVIDLDTTRFTRDAFIHQDTWELPIAHYVGRGLRSEEDAKWTIRARDYSIVANGRYETGPSGGAYVGFGGLSFHRPKGCYGDPIKGFDVAGLPVYAMHTIPTTIEAEHYDYFVTDGEGRTYHDLTTENSGGIYRTDEGVDLEVSSDGGYNITDFEMGEYLTYTVSAPGPGTYAIKVRYAAENADGKINFAFDGEDATGNVTLPATGSLDTWLDHEVSSGVYLSAGAHSMKVSATGASSAFKLTSISLEVVSVAEFRNLATSGTASQSTTAYGGEAARAIDGNTNGNYNNNSVSHTSHEDGLKWWQVDLGKDYVITSVVVHNRTGSTSYSEILNNFTVEVINAKEDTVFSYFQEEYPNPALTVNTGEQKGRYVRIWKTSQKAITLAEVEVFGYEIQKKSQSITFDALPEKTVGDADFDAGAVASSGLPVTYTSSNTSVATIESGKIRLVGSGVTTITASQAGDDTYSAANEVAQVLMVSDPAKEEQTITLADFGAVYYGDAPFVPEASASSGLSLTFSSSNEQVAIITEGKIELKSAGVTEITARQAGDATYNPATATKTLTVQKIAQTITFEPLEPRKTSAEPFDPGATASSGLLVTYSSSNDTVATIVNNEVHIVGVGSTTITAYQVGSNAYQPADPVTQVLQVKKEQVITFEALPVKSVGDEPFDPGATVSSGLPITYTSSDADVAEIIDGKIHLKGSGVVTITASQPGDDLYFAADEVAQNMAVLGGTVLSVADGLRVYPNPVDTWVKIVNSSQERFTDYRLYAVNGQLLKSGSIGPTATTVHIALPNFHTGLYILKVSNQNTSQVFRLIKH
ncbi:galactose-binding domain-containing protein [Marinoscillum furvescens]|uniref:Putative secreted protein (Por secretion system target) n=1 Tax=Marinoscillum furvescens DSM 4134 TaxID=1122208 RepID=A0A3D9L1X8_MARFU|nr:carbohydrate-binding protein [Marinoscillum furvescens]RED98373.1 putative secreted protein (Por secretion system target) [Marinoscillum furvescens DSM 4134]